jgi:biopolymer transport protein ExbB
MTFTHALVRKRWAYFSFVSMLGLFYFLTMSEQQLLLAAEDGNGESIADEHIIIFMAKSAGIVFGPLLFFVSLALTALIVLLMLDLRLEKSIPPAFVEEFTATVNARKFREAFELARNNDSAVGRVLTAGMSRLQYGIDDAREASMNMLESIRSSKEQLNNYTAVIGTLGPMLGLVGTVYGMIESFKVLGAGGRPSRRSWPRASRTRWW